MASTVTAAAPAPSPLEYPLYDEQRKLRACISAVAMVADALALWLACIVGYKLYRQLPFGNRIFFAHVPFLTMAAIVVGIEICIFTLMGLYRENGSFLQVREFEIILRSLAFSVLGGLTLSYALRATPPRLLIATVLPFMVIMMIAERFLTGAGRRRWVSALRLTRRTLVLGTTDAGTRLFHRLAQAPQHGIRVVGFLATQPWTGATTFQAPSYSHQREIVSVWGELADLEKHIEQAAEPIGGLIVADALTSAQWATVLRVVRSRKLGLQIVPTHGGLYGHWVEYTQVGGIPLGTCRMPGEQSRIYNYTKRLLDVVLALAILTLATPFWGLIWMMIHLDSPGPAFFRQQRIGRNGKPFSMWKFRSLRVDSPTYAKSPSSADDARITGVGRWLRRLSLDELPQIWNVLRGEMSLVGPRPEMPFVVASYTDLQRERLRVTPGITGLWQISADRAHMIHENIEYDLYYIESQSLFLDLAILLNTAVFVIRGVGAW